MGLPALGPPRLSRTTVPPLATTSVVMKFQMKAVPVPEATASTGRMAQAG